MVKMRQRQPDTGLEWEGVGMYLYRCECEVFFYTEIKDFGTGPRLFQMMIVIRGEEIPFKRNCVCVCVCECLCELQDLDLKQPLLSVCCDSSNQGD